MESSKDQEFNNLSPPRKMVKYFSHDETPLFKLQITPFKTLNKIFKYSIRGSLIIVIASLFLYFMLGSTHIFLISLGVVVPLGVVAFLVISQRTELRQERFFCMTNKRVYLYGKDAGPEWVNYADLSSLKAVIFKKRKIMDRKNEGSIDFVSFDRDTGGITVNNVPNLLDTQKIIETILFEYGNINQRWEQMKKKTNFQFPSNFNVSNEKLDNIITRNKYLTIYAGVAFLITLVVGFVLFIFLPKILEVDASMKVLAQILALSLSWVFGSIFIVVFIVEKYLQKKRSSPRETVLRLDSNQISLSNVDSPLTIPLNPHITINYLKIFKPTYGWMHWNKDIDGITIKPSYNSPIQLTFGPVDDFANIFEILFCSCLVWKKESGLLLSKEQIHQFESLTDGKFAEMPEQLISYSKVLSSLVEKDLKPIEPSNEIYNSLRNYLDPDEQIFLNYTPIINIKVSLIQLILGGSGILIGGIIMGLGIANVFNASSLSTVIMFVGFGFLLASTVFSSFASLSFLGKRSAKKSAYIFTNQKLIMKHSNEYKLIPYTNISNVVREDMETSYEIEINLKSPIKGYLIPMYLIEIPRVPINDDLFNKIKYLVEKSQASHLQD